MIGKRILHNSYQIVRLLLLFKARESSIKSYYFGYLLKKIDEIEYYSKKKVFLRIICGRKIDVEALYKCCYRNGSINDARIKVVYEKVLQEWEKVHYSFFSINCWKKLECFFIKKGLFRLSAICRNKAKESVYKKGPTGLNLWSYVQCELEDGDIDSAKKHIIMLNNKWWFYYFRKEIIELKRVINIYYRKKNKRSEFSDYLIDKEIIIVGPTLPKGSFKHIDNQLIVRNNVSDENVDVSYYNGEFFETRIKNNDEVIKVINSCVKFKRLKEGIINNKILIKADTISSFQSVCFNGSFNMLPIMIFDLLSCGGEDIKVYGNNCFVGNTLHAKDYFVKDNNADYLYSFSQHIPYLQFMYLKHMYEIKLFTPDDELKRILRLGLDGYILQLEKNYS